MSDYDTERPVCTCWLSGADGLRSDCEVHGDNYDQEVEQ